ncbi:hypothetical protein GCM10011396_19270 [Undibacterium terreum]|uniref:Uncharacterized protein n=1 Tax=Undibacterium terreum TaxID=1224302 RepID=A0A916UGR3_9BURK|nr:hypothetical protein GCM10011396_19270 [Undibacterium terreum]
MAAEAVEIKNRELNKGDIKIDKAFDYSKNDKVPLGETIFLFC